MPGNIHYYIVGLPDNAVKESLQRHLVVRMILLDQLPDQARPNDDDAPEFVIADEVNGHGASLRRAAPVRQR